MKKIIIRSMLALGAMFMMTGCFSPSKVAAGEEGVMIKKPWIFGHGGVEVEPLLTGLTWTVWSTQVKRVSVKPFNQNETFDDLITADNNPVDFKVHLTFKHIKGKTPILVEQFGADWYKNKVREPLRASVREFTKSHLMFDMTTNPDTTRQLEIRVQEDIRKFMKIEGMPTELVLATVGKVSPPARVLAETINTGVQKQKVKSNRNRVLAESEREAAERASAKADKAYMDEMEMSPDQYLSMKKLENDRAAIDGASEGKFKMNLIMGNAQPMFNVDQ